MPGGAPKDNIIFGISPKWSKDIKLKNFNNPELMCGIYGTKLDLSLAYSEYYYLNSNSAHMTIVFNVFVLYTLFNQVNCRVIDDSYHIFVRIKKNGLFPIITLGELFLQITIVETGASVFKCTERGLTFNQWLICIAFSLLTFVLSFIIKLIPINNAIQNILDNKAKSNKVANIEDLVGEENELNNSRIPSQANNYIIYQRNDDNLMRNNKNRRQSKTSIEVEMRKKKPSFDLIQNL
jgi:hypothetical protein